MKWSGDDRRRWPRPTTAKEQATPLRNAEWIDMLSSQVGDLSLRAKNLADRLAQLDGDHINQYKGGRVGALYCSRDKFGERIGGLEKGHQELGDRFTENRWRTRAAIVALGAGGAGGLEIALRLLGG